MKRWTALTLGIVAGLTLGSCGGSQPPPPAPPAPAASAPPAAPQASAPADPLGPRPVPKPPIAFVPPEPRVIDGPGRSKIWLLERHNLPLTHPRVALMDLQYHDVNRHRGLYYRMQDKNLVERVVSDEAIDKAVIEPPQTTRARLRGEFIRRAKERKRDYTVDWVHLKLNDQAQRTVLCKDPFKARDERVEKLIASL